MHPSPDVLALLALGEKAGTAEERVHVDSCPVCLAEVAEFVLQEEQHPLLDEGLDALGAEAVAGPLADAPRIQPFGGVGQEGEDPLEIVGLGPSEGQRLEQGVGVHGSPFVAVCC